MWRSKRRGRVDRLSAYWDERGSGQADAAALATDLDPVLVETIEQLYAHDDAQLPDPRFLAQLETTLMDTMVLAPGLRSLDAPAPPAPNGRAIPILRPTWPPLARAPRWHRGPLASVATAALVVLMLVGSFFAFGPGRPTHREELSAILPAVNGTPATPEAGAGPIAEFLWQANGGPSSPLGRPSQPAIDPAGTVWVPDSEHDRFLLFASDGTFLEAWGTPGSGEGEFYLADPRSVEYKSGGVAFDAAGNIYVADTGNYRIQKFGSDRAFISAWGSEGSDAGQFRRPVALAVDERGRVYVCDEGWGKIEVFDGDGAWLATWSGLGAPTGITVARDGTLWVPEFSGSVVQFSADGDRLATWTYDALGDGVLRDLEGVAVDDQGRVFVADLSANRVQVFSPDGTWLGAWGERGTAAGQFQQPIGIVLDGKGSAYVTDFAGRRLQKFRLVPPLAQ